MLTDERLWEIEHAANNARADLFTTHYVSLLLAHIRELEAENARLRASDAHNSVKLNEVLCAVLHGADNPVCPPHSERKECIETGDCVSCWEKHLLSLNVTKEATNVTP